MDILLEFITYLFWDKYEILNGKLFEFEKKGKSIISKSLGYFIIY